MTPKVVQRIVVVGAETRWYDRAVVVRGEMDVLVSPRTAKRVMQELGQELAARPDALPKSRQALAPRPENVPELAAVDCDGGRIRCRQPGHRLGVHLAGHGWRDSRAAGLIRCTRRAFDHAPQHREQLTQAQYRYRCTRKTFDHDPQPEPPECFTNPQHVARLAATEAPSGAAVVPADAAMDDDKAKQPESQRSVAASAQWRPQRLVRTVPASIAEADALGKPMHRQAGQHPFDESPAKAFLGDGLAWNWTIGKRWFRECTPSLDFIHVLSYLFQAARAAGAPQQKVGDQYVVWVRGCRRGEVEAVLEELRLGQNRRGIRRPKRRPPILARRCGGRSHIWSTTGSGWLARSTPGKGCR